MVKNLPAMWENWVQSLEKELATHSSILAWRIPTERGAWRATVHGVAKSWTRLSRHTLATTHNNWDTGEGRGWDEGDILESFLQDLVTDEIWAKETGGAKMALA